MISIDADEGTIEVALTDAELEARRKDGNPARTTITRAPSGYAQTAAQPKQAQSATQGKSRDACLCGDLGMP